MERQRNILMKAT